MAKQAETFTQVQVSLPAALLAYVQRQATLKDHTLSGAIRHCIAEVARLEPPPAPKRPTLPNVEGNPESIAKAKHDLAEKRQEHAQITQRQRSITGTTVGDDARLAHLTFEINWLEGQIARAEQMTRPANGGGAQ